MGEIPESERQEVVFYSGAPPTRGATLTHAKEFAKAYPAVLRVEFCCTWQGLKGRKIGEFEVFVGGEGNPSHTLAKNLQYFVIRSVPGVNVM